MSLPKIYGLIGYPVKHSLSPVMHNAAFQALKINAEYRLFPLKEGQIRQFLNNLGKEKIFGLNVTVPYKEKVLAFLDEISQEAKLIGAVNTIRRTKHRLLGFNTDGKGFLRHLQQDLKFNPKDKSIAVLGAGGASRAITVYLSKARPKRISIYDIDASKAVLLIEHLKENFSSTEFINLNSPQDLFFAAPDLFINATSCGMKDSDPLPIAPDLLPKNIFVYDIIYNPIETNLLKIAKEKGNRISNGLGMLLYQGFESFNIWMKPRKAPLEIMRRALMKEMCK